MTIKQMENLHRIVTRCKSRLQGARWQRGDDRDDKDVVCKGQEVKRIKDMLRRAEILFCESTYDTMLSEAQWNFWKRGAYELNLQGYGTRGGWVDIRKGKEDDPNSGFMIAHNGTLTYFDTSDRTKIEVERTGTVRVSCISGEIWDHIVTFQVYHSICAERAQSLTIEEMVREAAWTKTANKCAAVLEAAIELAEDRR